jgi:hypothetical protein
MEILISKFNDLAGVPMEARDFVTPLRFASFRGEFCTGAGPIAEMMTDIGTG